MACRSMKRQNTCLALKIGIVNRQTVETGSPLVEAAYCDEQKGDLKWGGGYVEDT